MNVTAPTPVSSDASPARAAALRVGEWRVDAAVNEIARDGETVRLEPKTMEVLAFLAERPAQVISRDVLLARLWPGVVVGDDALTQAVIKLRRALSDDPRSPRYIETISKRGYRLIAPVEPLDRPAQTAAPADAPGAASTPAREPRRRLWRAGMLVAAVALLTTLGTVAYRVSQPGSARIEAAPALPDDAAQRWASLPTLTVEPLEAIAADRDEAYLARGIGADLLTDLSLLSGVRVISSRATHQADTPVAAHYLLGGSVQRVEEVLKINVRLIDGESGRVLWAERYERPFRELLGVQQEIIGHILHALPVQISEAERRRLSRRYTRNLDAYDQFLRAKATFLVRRADDNAAARAMYWKAIELDPAFARAYAGLALTYANDFRYQWTKDGEAALTRAVELAQAALRVDPDLPEAQAVLAYVYAVRRQHDDAIKLLQQVIAFAPSYADAYAHLGAVYVQVGQPAKAIPLLRTASRLNPDAGFIYFVVLGRAYLFLGDLDQALLNLREALARNVADLETHVYLAAALVAAGDLSAAQWEAKEIRTLRPGFAASQWLQTDPMTDPAQRQRLITLLSRVEL